MKEKWILSGVRQLPIFELSNLLNQFLFTVVFCFVFIGIGKGQIFEVKEVLRSVIGNEQGEVATSVLELEDGGFLLVGYEYDNWDSEWDAIIIRVGANGHQIWRRSSDRPGNDYAWAVRRANENRFVVVGTRTTDNGDAAGYMECIDGDGEKLWLRTYGGSKNEVLWAEKQTTDGGFILVGQTDSEGAGGLDFFIVRTDSEGHELWSRAFGGPATDRAFGVDLSQDGGALIAGFQGENPEAMNILLLRIDAKGNELWRRTLAGDRFDVAHNVVRVADGGFVITGYTSSFSPGDQDGFLMRLSDEGRMLWMKLYGDDKDDRVLHSAMMPDGGFVFVGYSKPVEGQIWDMVIRRVDPQGELLWSHSVFGAVGKDVIVCHDGSVLAVGSTRSSVTSFDDILILRLATDEAYPSNNN
jgi:hypothetical protein